MITVKDQIGQSHNFIKTPQRIVSLVPSQTELLVDLGLADSLLGLTKFCVHPKHLRKQKTVVGGTKQIDLDKIKDLAPDIILCNKEENTKEMVQALSQIAPVHVSDVKTLEDTYVLIEQYGIVFNVQEPAEKLVAGIKNKAQAFKNSLSGLYSKSCLYLIWRKPYMVAGQDTFINHLLVLNGFTNKCREDRYPELDQEDMFDVDYVLLSSEPYPFKEAHIREIERYTSGKVILVDGEYFSWYGSRLLYAFDYFEQLQEFL